MKLNVAVIGSGKSAAENHIPAYQRIPDVQVVAIADTDPERANLVAQQFGIKGVYDDYGVMLRRRRPELVSICAPPSEHKDIALYALSRGVHVLCDVPTALNADQAQRMFDAAKEADRVLTFAAPRRFEAETLALKQAVTNRDLGAVCLCHAWFQQKGIAADELWKIKAKEGGGALCVCGQEMLDAALWLVDDAPVSVSGQLFHRFSGDPDIPKTWFGSRRELDAEDLVVALIRCEKSLVSLEVDWLASGDDSGIRVVGTKGRGCTSPFRIESASKGRYVDTTPTFFPETSAWEELVGCFIDASQGRRKPFPEWNDVVRVHRICAAIRKASLSGREIPLSDVQ